MRRVGDCYSVLLKEACAQTTAILTNALSFLMLGLNTPRVPAPTAPQPRASSQPPPATKSVQFDLGSDSSSISSAASPSFEKNRKGHHQSSGGENHQHSTKGSNSSPFAANDSPRLHRRRASQSDLFRSPSPTPSDATIDMPERFDQYGRRKPERGEDPLADTIDDLFLGNGAVGKFLNNLTGAFGGGNGEDGDGGRRRRRR